MSKSTEPAAGNRPRMPSRSSQESLTGTWQTESGVYFVTESGAAVWWLGIGHSSSWAHVFMGRRCHDGAGHDTVRGSWGDIPLGHDVFHGTLAVRVHGGAFARVEQTGGFGCQRWTKYGPSRASDLAAQSPFDQGACNFDDAAFFEACPGYWGDDYCTGVYDCDHSEHGAAPGLYFVSQWGKDVFWFGRSKGTRQWAHVAHGQVRGSEMHMEWCDIPLCADTFCGSLVLESNIKDDTLKKTHDSSGVFGGILWKKRHNRFARWVAPSTFSLSVGERYQTFVLPLASRPPALREARPNAPPAPQHFPGGSWHPGGFALAEYTERPNASHLHGL